MGGYKAYFTEPCDEDSVHLITYVVTITVIPPDFSIGENIHDTLADKDLLPREPLLDAGHIAVDLLVSAHAEHGVEVCGPVKKNVRWQAQAGQGYGSANFIIDRAAHTVTCPVGQTSTEMVRTTQYRDTIGNPSEIQAQRVSRLSESCALYHSQRRNRPN